MLCPVVSHLHRVSGCSPVAAASSDRLIKVRWCFLLPRASACFPTNRTCWGVHPMLYQPNVALLCTRCTRSTTTGPLCHSPHSCKGMAMRSLTSVSCEETLATTIWCHPVRTGRWLLLLLLHARVASCVLPSRYRCLYCSIIIATSTTVLWDIRAAKPVMLFRGENSPAMLLGIAAHRVVMCSLQSVFACCINSTRWPTTHVLMRQQR